ncbi:MAG: DUF4961 domain-containing protein, partial [Chitinophaga rupis]
MEIYSLKKYNPFSRVRKFFKKNPSYYWKVPGFILLLIVISCSVKIDSVVQPGSINAGDVLPVTLNATIMPNADQTSKFMVAVLVPKVWNASKNATITFTSDITTGNQPMTLIPAGTPAPQGNGLDWPTLLVTKIGNGGNLLPDYEWVAFYSNSSYSVSNGNNFGVVVTIKIKTSPDNISFKMGYCIAESTDGLSDPQYFSSSFPGCLTANGAGDLIDFCNPQLSTVDPRTSLDNDLITINFDGGVEDNTLKGASQVYLCVTAYTSTGDSVVVCNPTAATQMTGLGLNRWEKDIWPRGYFKLADNQTLTR